MDGVISPLKIMSYYSPNKDCGFQGGVQAPSALGMATNAHAAGSGMNKVFREVTIIRTGGAGSAITAKERRMERHS